MSEPTDGSPSCKVPAPGTNGNLPVDSPWWARWLVANWKDAWKFATNNWAFWCGNVATAYALYPDQFNEALKFMEGRWPHVTAVAFYAILVLRNVNFVKPKGEQS